MTINEKVISKALDWAYERAVTGGIPGTSDAYELAEEFLQKKGDFERPDQRTDSLAEY